MENVVRIIGGGLAGAEAAWQLARRGISVELFEMRPQRMTEAHAGSDLGELVCSNSLRSDLPSAPAGLLKAEMRCLDSLIIRCADRHRVPAPRSSVLRVTSQGWVDHREERTARSRYATTRRRSDGTQDQ